MEAASSNKVRLTIFAKGRRMISYSNSSTRKELWRKYDLVLRFKERRLPSPPVGRTRPVASRQENTTIGKPSLLDSRPVFSRGRMRARAADRHRIEEIHRILCA